jgi:hypothetical protein
MQCHRCALHPLPISTALADAISDVAAADIAAAGQAVR